jgi:hypothetical protein
MFGEWLIDYSDGFGRRGLVGQIIGFLSFGNWTAAQITTYVLYMLLLATQILLFRNIVTKEPSLIALLLLFAPGAFLVFVADPGYSGRKEILLIILFLATIWIASEREGTPLEFFLLGLSWVAMGLIHEGLLIFAPAAGALFFGIAGKKYGVMKKWWFSLVPSLSSGLVFFSLFAFSSERSPDATCNRWLELGASQGLCEGAISWIGRDLQFATGVTTSTATRDYLVTFLPYLVLCIAVLVFLIRKLSLSLDSKALVFFALITAGFGVISTVSVDWGRWLSLSFIICLLFIFAYAKNFKTSVVKDDQIPRRFELLKICTIYALIAPPHYGTSFQSPLTTLLEVWTVFAALS